MTWLRNLTHGLRSLIHKPSVDRELDEELAAFAAASAADKQRSGMSAREARRAARAEIGSMGAVKHQVWSSRWEGTFDAILQDTRFSLRMLLKSPGFTFVALLSLALGIGANTAIFTLLNQVLLQNLPVEHPEQLVTLGETSSSGVAGGIDLGDYGLFPWYFARQLASDHGPFQGIASYCSFSDKASIRLPGSASTDAAILAPVTLVSGNYFDLIGAHPFLGRAINNTDDATPGSGAVVVLSYHFWQEQLSANPNILGKTLTVNGTPFAIVGIMPPSFHGLKQDLVAADLWTPISMQPQVLSQASFLTRDGPYFLQLFARLSPQAANDKAAFAQSQAWLDQQIRTGIRANDATQITPAREGEIARHTVPLIPAARGASFLRSRYGASLWILMGVVGLVLLIACANLANFLLARATARQRELATRLALGSSRIRILRQSLIETLLLSLLGGALGLTLAFVATRVLIAYVSNGEGYTALSPTPDPAVLLFTLGVCVTTALLFGIAPALTAARTGAGSLTSNTRVSTAGRSAQLLPKSLVAAQVILSLLLLITAGLFLRTLQNLQDQDFGFDSSHLLIAWINPKLVGYKPSQTPALHQSLLERISAIPGVRSAALAAAPPMSSGNWSSSFKIEGYTPGPKESMNSVLNRVSGQYFETAGIPIITGRAIGDSDTQTTGKVAIINESAARRFFPKGGIIGRNITIDIDSVKGPWRIVGIARDTKNIDPRQTDQPIMIWIPLAQIPPMAPVAFVGPPTPGQPVPQEENQDRFASVILARTTGDPAKTIADLRSAVTQVDPNLPIIDIRTIEQHIGGFMTQLTLVSRLCGFFSILALVLAAIGLYGVMSYSVVRRTSEIGIRLALGAQAQTVLWMILRESLLLLIIGVAVGLPLTLSLTRLLRDQLYGLTATDPITFAGAIAVVALITVVAAWLPARRAAKVDPMIALRCE
ncbi:ABC transporter permease [Acidicapsa dinghuensis]|uniref:ABC transporter permease n=1 Tax=Acidicapsa dinghuensis TaxID=2218256 RepID=A0ABW1EJ46_9BACT|nr:ABC transporter permease [Acidicapsa dinghuensis]